MDFKLFTTKVDDEGHPTESSEKFISKNSDIMNLKYPVPEFFLNDTADFLDSQIYSSSINRQKGETSITTLSMYILAPFYILGLENSEKYPDIYQRVISFLSHRLNKDGIFAGFETDHPALIFNMFSVATLAICGTEEAYKLINREAVYRLLLQLKNGDGSFQVSLGGEFDLRSTYSALVLAKLLNIMTPEITENVFEFVKKCYNPDGGFAPVPHCESHAGYVHCGIGILYILGRLQDLDLYKCVRFIAMRQDAFSGGFNGRPNKLVDSCYSWWLGTASRILADHFNIEPFWNVEAMSRYIIQCCQLSSGGFCDSPPSFADTFHTCFALSGLCMVGSGEIINEDLCELDVLLPVPKQKMEKLINYFEKLPHIV